MANTINEYFQPSSTGSHNNIDNLILQAELDKFAQTGSIREDKTPRYIGGTDDVVANMALSPILTLKSMGNVGRKILEKTGLRNPVSHYTHIDRLADILEEGTIKGAKRAFPGKAFKEEAVDKRLRKLYGEGAGVEKSPAVSVTRDPMFLERSHVNIGTGTRLILDRDEMIKKGLKIEPYAETSGMPGYSKTLNDYSRFPVTLENYRKIHGQYPNQMNPRFEFEERIRGYIPTKNIKLIDLLKFPQGAGSRYQAADIINALGKTDIPIIRNPQTTEQIETMSKMFSKYNLPAFQPKSLLESNLNKLLESPTYKFDPFKR
tara:strand:+ start:373 stop:1329 length:957 start_codon:yes stop_codon:yes gene_type:complete